jgi:hypothetical protein
MSRLAAFRQNVREKVTSALGIDEHTVDEEAHLEPTPEEIAKEEEDSKKHEYRLVIILEKVRELYQRKGFVGSVDISRSFLCTSNSLSCDIDGSGGSEETPLDDSTFAETDKVPMLSKITINNVTRLLARLESRAKNYRNKPYKDDLTISGSVGFTDPMGFSGVSISCNATVSSLLHGK